MKRYKSHKIVHAEPMTAHDHFIGTRGFVPKNIDKNSEGYRVIYSAGTPEEYISWSPKKAFDEGYSEIKSYPA